MTREEPVTGPGGPLVSILMPAFNHAAFVDEAVTSVWRQTWRPIELIAVDDGSRDSTPRRLAELARRAPIPMRVIEQSNRGIAGALNRARREASGEWLGVLASDDAFLPDKVERQMAAIARRPRAVAVHSDYLCVGVGDGDGDGDILQGSRLPAAEGDCHRDLLRGRRTVHSTTLMVRASALDAVGGWDESYPQEDWPLILRLSRRGEIAYCPRPLVRRRVHADNVSTRMSRRRAFDPADAAIDLLREMCPAADEFAACASVHVATVLRNSIAQRGWRRARGAFAWAWRELPSRRRFLLAQVAGGLRSLVWLRLARPLLPAALAKRLAAWRTRRLDANAGGSGAVR